MKTIPMEVVDAVWDRLAEVSEAEARELAQRAQDVQPFLMVYLLAMDETVMDEANRGRLMELGAIILEVMYTEAPDLRMVTEADLETAEEKNVRLLEELEEGSEFDYTESVEALLNNYNQMPLLSAVIEALMHDADDQPEQMSENSGAALLYLKTVIDCLDQ